MFLKLLPFLIIIPIIELYLLIKLGEYIGIIFTLIILSISGIIGLILVKKQGWETINRVKNSLACGRFPANEVIEGLLILCGGLLLLTPGFITDAIGFTLLLPYTRKFWRNFLTTKFLVWLKLKTNIFYY